MRKIVRNLIKFKDTPKFFRSAKPDFHVCHLCGAQYKTKVKKKLEPVRFYHITCFLQVFSPVSNPVGISMKTNVKINVM